MSGRTLLAALALLACAGPALAQAESAGCRQQKAAAAEPATKPAPDAHDGTAPGNAGSTGWSGGLGGSTIGTSPNASAAGQHLRQPVTARGLDPIAGMTQPAVAAGC